MAIKVRKPAFSRFAEASFECLGEHTTKKFVWNDCFEIACATCGEPASRLLPRRLRRAQGIEPTCYAVKPETGELWVPGVAGKKPPKGYEPREIRTFRDRDQFYRERREIIERDHANFALGHEAEFGSFINDGHAQLRRYLSEGRVPEIDRETNEPTGNMVPISPEGRGFIQHALDQGGYKRPEWGGAEVSIAVWENDRPEFRE